MESEFPSNSNRGKKIEGKDQRTPEPRKKVEQVTTGEVIKRKRPWYKKVSSAFETASTSVFFEVLIPAAQDTLRDVVTEGIEKMISPDGGRSRGRRGSRSGGYNGRVDYQPYNRYASSSIRRDRDEPRSARRAPGPRANFDEHVLGSRHEAEAVIDGLFEIISQYEVATVADLHALLGISSDHVDNKWGWTDLRSAGPTRVRGGGYLLDLPRPEPVD